MENLPVARDEIDTVRVVTHEHMRSTCQSASLAPAERCELVLEPTDTMIEPTLTLLTDQGGGCVVVEQIACGQFVVCAEPGFVSDYASGHALGERVSKAEPLRVLLNNSGVHRHKITATLSVVEKSGAYCIDQER
jgi:hypothetical protein